MVSGGKLQVVVGGEDVELVAAEVAIFPGFGVAVGEDDGGFGLVTAGRLFWIGVDIPAAGGVGRKGDDFGEVTALRHDVWVWIGEFGDAGISHEPDLAGAFDVGGFAAAEAVLSTRAGVGVADDGAFDRAVTFPASAKDSEDVFGHDGGAAPDVVGDGVGGEIFSLREKLPPPEAAGFDVTAGPCLGVEIWKSLVEIVGVEMEGEAELATVIEALHGLRFDLGAGESGEEQTGEDRNDGDDDQEFDESESAARGWRGHKDS